MVDPTNPSDEGLWAIAESIHEPAARMGFIPSRGAHKATIRRYRAVFAAGRAAATPDRESIACLIYPNAWAEPILPETYRETSRRISLRVADDVLALINPKEENDGTAVS